MVDFKALVFDMDGTLLNSDKEISPRTAGVIERCRDKGVVLIIATARPPRLVSKFEFIRDMMDYWVCFNGGVVMRAGKVFQRNASLARDLIAELSKKAGESSFLIYETEDNWFASRELSPGEREMVGTERGAIEALSYQEIIDSGNNIYKLLAPEDLIDDAIRKKYRDQATFQMLRGMKLLQIMNARVSKADGVKTVAENTDIEPEEIIAFGDDYNDLELFEFCGTGVAMGNTVEELKAKADHITAGHDEDGIAVFLEEILAV